LSAAEKITVALLAGALVSFVTRESCAYCIATTCDSSQEQCPHSPEGCVIPGARLHWASACLSFGVQRDGSPLRHVSYQVADSIIRSAFEQWMRVDCGGGKHPSFRMWDLAAPYGGIICNEPEFNPTKPNANVWIFRDKDWPYKDETSTLALTSTIFEKTSGALLDADVEINSYANPITTTSVASEVGKDLASIVTHEAGHFLGMGHSDKKDSTMYAQYQPGDLNYRSLQPDDAQGICAIYPPDRDVPECKAPSPAHGFSLYCGGESDDGTASVSGCACSLHRDTRVPWRAGLLLMGLAALRLRRRVGAPIRRRAPP